MQDSKDNEDKNVESVLTQGKVIKIVEELEFGVLETEDSDFLFFHVSNFDSDVDISDIKEGDLILCNQEVQASDGRKAAINCQRVEFRGYLKDYFIDNALTAPNDVASFDEFCENAREYAGYLVEEEVDFEKVEDLKNRALAVESAEDLKKISPELKNRMEENKDNKTFVEFIDIMYQLINRIDLDDDIGLENYKSFIQILMSYTQFV